MAHFKNMNLNKYHGSKGGNYFEEGDFVCRILSTIIKEKRDGHTAFIAELEVLESNNENIKIGSKRSIFIKLSDAQYPDTALGNIADFMRAATASATYIEGGELMKNFDGVVIEDDDADDIVGPGQPLAGYVMGVHAYMITTRAGNPFTKHEYFVPENAREHFASAA